MTSEASSLAGHQQLGNLVLIYDDNHISIEDDTDVAFSEDVAKRYEAYGWHVQTVDWTNGRAPSRARRRLPRGRRGAARRAGGRPRGAVADRPSSCSARSSPGRPPTPRTPARRTAPRSATTRSRPPRRCSASTPTPTFAVDDDVLEPRPRRPRPRRRGARAAGSRASSAWKGANPERAELLGRLTERRLPDGLGRGPADLRRPARTSPPARPPARSSTRSPRCCPSCGAARPTWPRATTPPWRARRRSSPSEWQTGMWQGGPYGRILHFGIREHAMGSILNGIALHGATRPYGGTFLVFSDYMRPAVRLAALSQDAGHLRLDARLDRPRRGRPDPPAGRAPGRAARHPRPRRGPPGRRQRDRRGLAHHPRAHRPPGRHSC